MANIKFISSENSNVESELTAHLNSNDELFIRIDSADDYPQFVCLDKETAELFLRHITEELSKLD